LKGVLFTKGILKHAHLTSLNAQAFDRGDLHAIGLNGKHATRSHWIVVQQHRASTADAVFTPDMRAGQGQRVSKKVNQSGSGFYITFVLHAIDGDGNGQFVVHGWVG
jgi:hypothetical protein